MQTLHFTFPSQCGWTSDYPCFSISIFLVVLMTVRKTYNKERARFLPCVSENREICLTGRDSQGRAKSHLRLLDRWYPGKSFPGEQCPCIPHTELTRHIGIDFPAMPRLVFKLWGGWAVGCFSTYIAVHIAQNKCLAMWVNRIPWIWKRSNLSWRGLYGERASSIPGNCLCRTWPM